MNLTYGELFAGYGGLGMGVQSVLGGEMAWYADACKFDKDGNASHYEPHRSPCAIMAHHHPDAPNLGDVTKVDWASVPKVDVITGGSPCQDLSHAGKRAGMKAGTRSGLWASMCDAIDIIRPRLVVWENVRGALSAEATSAVEPCPLCVGDGTGTTLRALGRVCGDLAELRYDARWYGLRAADVGAAHGRFRVFLFATPANAQLLGYGAEAGDQAFGQEAERPAGWFGGCADNTPPVPGQLTLLPTPTTVEGTGPGSHGTGGDNLRTVVDQLLPTPNAGMANGGNVQSAEAIVRGERQLHLTDLPRLLGSDESPRQDWREYEAAIRRQEAAFGRPAPLPTEPGAKGQPRLSPSFVEWLMGLPAGHVTDVPGISRNDQLKALGNGVVPQQAAAATRAFLHDISKVDAA